MGPVTSFCMAMIATFATVLALFFDLKNKTLLFKGSIIGIILFIVFFAIIIDHLPERLIMAKDDTLSVKYVQSSIRIYSKGDPGITFPYEITLLHNTVSDTDYQLDFTLPEKGDANVGLAFNFDKKEDLSIYKWLELTTTFGDDDIGCQLFLRDAANTDGFVDLAKSSPSIIQSFDGKKKVFKIRLDSNFNNVDLSIVKGIFLVTGSQQIPGRGSHFLIVHDIRFLKE